jgi:ribonucleoside-diphosphate reductase alpha chain
MRMLDNVIDINYYAVKKARNSNLRHRPVGLGIMGFQDCLYLLRMPYASRRRSSSPTARMEAVCYYAYWASTELAEERGRYSSFRAQPVGPRHPAAGHAGLLAESAAATSRSTSATLDWDALRERIRQHGMRNSNCVAIAPTATISNIIGVDASIEPTFRTCSSRATCRASSPSSTSTWCAT